ncbi:early set domain-containing protein [Flindersiella endophytica]
MLHRELLPNGQTQLTFSLPAHDPPGEVSVVGDFNGWRAGLHQMLMSENDVRQVSVTVEPGIHYFRYLATGGRWADEREADLITEHGSVVHCAETDVIELPEQATGERRRGDMMDARLDPPPGQHADRPTVTPMPADTPDQPGPRMDTDSDLAPESSRR